MDILLLLQDPQLVSPDTLLTVQDSLRASLDSLRTAHDVLLASVDSLRAAPQALPPDSLRAAEATSSDAASWFVGLGAALATFLASVMADEQDQRLKNGTYGTIAGSSVGGLAALLTQQPALLIVGFLGSGVGGFVGWGVAMILSFIVNKPARRGWLEYYVGGFQGLRDKLNLEDERVILSGLDAWRMDFIRMISRQKLALLSRPRSYETDHYIQLIINAWLVSVVDVFALIFMTLADKPQYRSRVTIIIYGKDPKNQIIGKHWIAYSGALAAHKKTKPFQEDSIGYKVLKGELRTPYFTTGEAAKKDGDDRGGQTYRPFYTFRLNDSAILAIDWPDELKDNPANDPYVKRAADLFNLDVSEAIGELLDHWSRPLSYEVGLDPLAAGSLP